MNAVDPLATGTLLLLDGRGAAGPTLADPDGLDALLGDLARRIEPSGPRHHLRCLAGDGSSHLVLLDEGHLMLHVFPEPGRFALQAFSRHAMPDAELQRSVCEALRVGRSESALRRRAADLPEGDEALRRRLAGERAWARARLVPLPVPEAD